MTREFKVGDEIIMEADSGKGEVPLGKGLPYGGIYKGEVKEVADNTVSVLIYDTDDIISFSMSGRHCVWPGLSIRHADKVRKETLAVCRKCNGTTDNINTHVCVAPKQEWVKGQIPEDYRGWVWVWHTNFVDNTTCRLMYSGEISSIKKEVYTHWMPAELPPPPPIDEVEAYGIMEAVDKLIPIGAVITSSIVMKIGIYRNFFSLPATAENLNKYFIPSWSNKEWEYNHDCNIDEFINGAKNVFRDGEAKDKLIFTAAALEALGVK